MWPQIIAWVALSVVSYLIRPKDSTSTSQTAEDIDVTIADDGQIIPVIFGTVDIANASVAWAGHKRVVAIRKKGGKK